MAKPKIDTPSGNMLQVVPTREHVLDSFQNPDMRQRRLLQTDMTAWARKALLHCGSSDEGQVTSSHFALLPPPNIATSRGRSEGSPVTCKILRYDLAKELSETLRTVTVRVTVICDDLTLFCSNRDSEFGPPFGAGFFN